MKVNTLMKIDCTHDCIDRCLLVPLGFIFNKFFDDHGLLQYYLFIENVNIKIYQTKG